MAAGDLTTLANVRAFMQKPVADTDQDALISSLITRASTTIARWAGREFAPATTAATRTFSHAGGGFLDLAPYDLRSVSLATSALSGGTPLTLTSPTDYLLGSPADGVYTYLRLAEKYGSWPANEPATISITGDWGFASVPADVEHWCIVTVVTWLRRDVAAFSTTFSLDEERVERPEALPSAVRAGLAPYRRIAVG